MKNDDLYLEIRMLVAVIAKRAMRALEQRLGLANGGISGLQHGIIHALYHQEHTISELSDKFMLDPSTLVPAVDALERKGLARRGRDPDDRRRVPLSLTERGAELVSCAPFVDDSDPLVQSLNTMGDEQCHQLLMLLREMVRHMPDGEEILSKVSSRVRLHTGQKSAVREC